jgi:Holliday junction resolvasome RuvABC DNA-binding subunit
MIATLTGKVSEKLRDSIVVDVKGVGFGVYVTSEDQGKLAVNDEIKVYIYEHVREACP